VDFNESFYAELAADTDITDLVGGASDPRIYPVKAPQDSDMPVVLFQTISGIMPHLMGSDDGFGARIMQVAAWGDTLASARGVADKVKACLQDFAGTLGGDGGVTIQRIFLETPPIESFDPNAGTEGFWAVIQDFTCWIEE